jgi:hypothetical protein
VPRRIEFAATQAKPASAGWKNLNIVLVHEGGLCLCSSELYSKRTFQTSSDTPPIFEPSFCFSFQPIMRFPTLSAKQRLIINLATLLTVSLLDLVYTAELKYFYN